MWRLPHGPHLAATGPRAVAWATTANAHAVTQADYLWAPIVIGAIAAGGFVILAGIIGVPFVEPATNAVSTVRLLSGKFWRSRFYASAAWTFGDSGATNITALGAAVVALLAQGTVLNVIFPNVDLSPFIIMNVACGALVALTPLLFSIANVAVSRRYPMAPADATVSLTADATMTFPAGAQISVPGGAQIKSADGTRVKARVNPGTTLALPPGCTVTARAGTHMCLPSAAVVPLGSGATLTIDVDIPLPPGAAVPVPAPAAHRGLRPHKHQHAEPSGAGVEVGHGDLIVLPTGAIVTVTGAADLLLPAGAMIVAPGRRGMGLKTATTITVPSGPNVMAAGMLSLLPAAALTTFGIGAEIGLVAVLAAHYGAPHGGQHAAAVVISLAVAIGLVLYSATGIRSLAEPGPGSSLNAGAGTSFTL